MQWYEYFHEVKDGMFHSTRRSRVEWNIASFTEWKYSYHCTNIKHIHYLFYMTPTTFAFSCYENQHCRFNRPNGLCMGIRPSAKRFPILQPIYVKKLQVSCIYCVMIVNALVHEWKICVMCAVIYNARWCLHKSTISRLMTSLIIE